MSAALDLYAKLTETTDEKERARLIASAFDALEARFPQINELATQGHVRETELRLQKEIKEVEARLQEQIKGVELQIKEVERHACRSRSKASSCRSSRSKSICTRPWLPRPAGCSAALPCSVPSSRSPIC
jgi:hypothetical protein